MIDDVDRSEDDFLAFWDQHRAAQNPDTKRILGVDVVVPSDIPLSFGDTFAHLQSSEDPEDVKQLLAILFGDSVFDQWLANRVTAEQLKILLAWGVSNAYGKPTTFAEAATQVAEAEALKAKAEAEGKAPTPINRAGRRASSKTAGSGGTGRSSKPTSPASTA